ncbi:MAG: hypothetical protein KDC49_00040 [Saprospiraceae bacterium]|nr:hypothetical protein [Saprospiraceae bacterium]
MGCTSCSPGGCGNKGHCATGSCNKMNTYDWITTMELDDPSEYNFIEVSYKNGARKEIYRNDSGPGHFTTGDYVLAEAASGYEVGQISLMGELVRLQMKKKGVTEDRVLYKVIRRANDRDMEKLHEARLAEKDALVKARAIARTLELEMKIGDVEYQGDLRKATFFYTANGRVDFRELVKIYAKEFRVKIEMRQIGSRQESARIGGIGSCGRELCCSTWLSDFRSVNTSAARYQNIAINQTKLSGQCGRLKCCLNYELDTYMDEIQYFPNRADVLQTKKGRANLMKTDIFKGLMFYMYEDISMKGVFHPLDKERVKEILALNAKGVMPEDLSSYAVQQIEKEKEIGFADVTGEIELPNSRRKKKKPKGRRPEERSSGPNNQGTKESVQGPPREPRNDNRETPRGDRPNRQGRDGGNNRPQKGPQPNNQTKEVQNPSTESSKTGAEGPDNQGGSPDKANQNKPNNQRNRNKNFRKFKGGKNNQGPPKES